MRKCPCNCWRNCSRCIARQRRAASPETRTTTSPSRQGSRCSNRHHHRRRLVPAAQSCSREASPALIIVAGLVAPRMLPLPDVGGPPAVEKTVTPAEIAPPDLQSSIKFLVIGFLVLGMIWAATAWFIRRRNAQPGQAGPRALNVAAALPLQHRCNMFLIEVGEWQFVAGVDGNGIQALLPLPRPAEEAPAAPAPSQYARPQLSTPMVRSGF